MEKYILTIAIVFLSLGNTFAQNSLYEIGQKGIFDYNVGTFVPMKSEQPKSHVSPVIEKSSTSHVVTNGCVIISDVNFRKLCIALYDTNKDKILSIEEAQAVKTINMSNSGINSLSGIEVFVNLETLVARNNKFIEANLSENKNLKLINLSSDAIQKVYLDENCNAEFDVPEEIIVRVKSK